MNKTAIYSTIVVSVIASLAVFAVSSSEVEAVPPSKVACPAENVQHWVVILVTPSKQIQHSTEPSFGGQFFMPLSTMGSELLSNENLRQDVVDKLNTLGYFVDDGGPRPVNISDLQSASFVSDRYSTICAEN